MATSETSVSFEESDTRHDEMHSTIEHWIGELVDHVDDAQESKEFQEWLDVQSRFHDYSHRNTLLIKLQCPEATRVAGNHTWRNDHEIRECDRLALVVDRDSVARSATPCPFVTTREPSATTATLAPGTSYSSKLVSTSPSTSCSRSDPSCSVGGVTATSGPLWGTRQARPHSHPRSRRETDDGRANASQDGSSCGLKTFSTRFTPWRLSTAAADHSIGNR